jgi:hypothetical protein
MSLEIPAIRGPIAPLDPAKLADRTAICQLCQTYALSVDLRNEEMLLSLFSPKATIHGWKGKFTASDYLPKLIGMVSEFKATQHTILNQFVQQEGDRATVWSYAVAYHIHKPELGLEDLVMGLRYQDQVERSPKGWWIVGREAAHQWLRGPAPAQG